MSSARRRLAAVSLAAVATLTLGACGFGYQTDKVYQAAVGANHRGTVDVLNTLLVVNQDKSATLSAGLINHTSSAQTLKSVSVTTFDGTPLTVKSSKTLLPLPVDVLTPIGEASDAGGALVSSGVVAGDYVKVTLTFSDAAEVTIEAPAVARTAEYDRVTGGDGIAPSSLAADNAN